VEDEYRKNIAGGYIAVISIGINSIIWREEVSFQIP
jgi:hypothetical protein